MKTPLLIVLLLLASGGATPTAAAPAQACRPSLDRCVSECPDRRAREDGRTYGSRALDYCKARWVGQRIAHETGGRTHDEFVDGCLRRCVAERNVSNGVPLGWILGGIGAAALAGGVAAGAGGGHSTTPPASP